MAARSARPARRAERAVAAGGRHTLAVSTEGRLFAWGQSAGALGTDAAMLPRASPRNPLELTASGPGAGAYVHSVAAGAEHSIVTTAGGEVWSWGTNANGQLGVGCAAGDIGTVRPPS